MKPFRRRRRGGVTATFDLAEGHLLSNLAGQVIELLRDRNGASESDADPLASQLGLDGPSVAPDDPVLQRLLPDAYRDLPEDAAEFRRYTEQALTSAKVANAEVLIGTLVEAGLSSDADADGPENVELDIELDDGEVQAWLRSLTDIRLALAVRLGIETEEDAMLVAESPDESNAAVADIYDWLGYVQESLVVALG